MQNKFEALIDSFSIPVRVRNPNTRKPETFEIRTNGRSVIERPLHSKTEQGCMTRLTVIRFLNGHSEKTVIFQFSVWFLETVIWFLNGCSETMVIFHFSVWFLSHGSKSEPFRNRTHSHHSKTEYVQYSDPHCT